MEGSVSGNGCRPSIHAIMFGEAASEIIQMVSVSLNAGITKKDFDTTMALHPTISEEFVTMYGP